MLNYKLTRGQTPVLYGKHGAGKTTEAIKMAEQAGNYAHVSVNQLMSDYGLGFLAEHWVDTIIVDEAISSDDLLARIKNLTQYDEIRVERKGEFPVMCKTPNFILTYQIKPEGLIADGARWFVFLEVT